MKSQRKTRSRRTKALSGRLQWILATLSILVLIVGCLFLDGYRFGTVPMPDFQDCDPPQPVQMMSGMMMYQACCGTSSIAVGQTTLMAKQLTSCGDWDK